MLSIVIANLLDQIFLSTAVDVGLADLILLPHKLFGLVTVRILHVLVRIRDFLLVNALNSQCFFLNSF